MSLRTDPQREGIQFFSYNAKHWHMLREQISGQISRSDKVTGVSGKMAAKRSREATSQASDEKIGDRQKCS